MNIIDLDTKTMTTTITLKYEELRDLSNLLYEADEKSIIKDIEQGIHANIFMLTTLLKHGFLPNFEYNYIKTLRDKYTNEVNKIAEANKKAGC